LKQGLGYGKEVYNKTQWVQGKVDKKRGDVLKLWVEGGDDGLVTGVCVVVGR
jgi:hypothetical protein